MLWPLGRFKGICHRKDMGSFYRANSQAKNWTAMCPQTPYEATGLGPDRDHCLKAFNTLRLHLYSSQTAIYTSTAYAPWKLPKSLPTSGHRVCMIPTTYPTIYPDPPEAAV